MIAILTDFSTKDPYVGIMKGVIHSINKDANIIDITHEIENYNILKASFYLKASYEYFPENTVFLCVVDPGVGSSRLPIACRYNKYFFVGPMNGIFDLVFEEKPKCVDISNHPFRLKNISNTFHGRDIFAPATAHLDKIKSIDFLGPFIEYKYSISIPKPIYKEGYIEGEILFYDHFGNGITNIKCQNFKYALLEDKKIDYYAYFSQAPIGSIGITCGSFGYLEFFVNQGCFKDNSNTKSFKLIV